MRHAYCSDRCRAVTRLRSARGPHPLGRQARDVGVKDRRYYLRVILGFWLERKRNAKRGICYGCTRSIQL